MTIEAWPAGSTRVLAGLTAGNDAGAAAVLRQRLGSRDDRAHGGSGVGLAASFARDVVVFSRPGSGLRLLGAAEAGLALMLQTDVRPGAGRESVLRGWLRAGTALGAEYAFADGALFRAEALGGLDLGRGYSPYVGGRVGIGHVTLPAGGFLQLDFSPAGPRAGSAQAVFGVVTRF